MARTEKLQTASVLLVGDNEALSQFLPALSSNDLQVRLYRHVCLRVVSCVYISMAGMKPAIAIPLICRTPVGTGANHPFSPLAQLTWITHIDRLVLTYLQNSVSIPCLAAMNATGSKASTLTNLFGGATNNEGLGLFTFSFDWQYITSFQTALPLKLQYHAVAGFIVCYAAMLGIYYTNAWDSLSQPFMSTRLRSADGTAYDSTDVFTGGVLNETALVEFGTPRLTGSFAFSMFMANAAIGALVVHCFVFWGGDVVRAFKSTAPGKKHDDPHHAYMMENYKEARRCFNMSSPSKAPWLDRRS